jgi:hypothetical protein
VQECDQDALVSLLFPSHIGDLHRDRTRSSKAIRTSRVGEAILLSCDSVKLEVHALARRKLKQDTLSSQLVIIRL